MKKEKIILLFSDLEGTIVNEEDGKYDDEAMYKFLEQISQLQELTGARVNIHLVSPIEKAIMKDIINQIETNMHYYNKLHPHQKPISEIEGASCGVELGSQGGEFLDDKIIPLKQPIDATNFDSSKFGKSNYVRNWVDIYNENEWKDLSMIIYCGNGDNDLSAMSFVRNQKQGFIVCPKNTREKAKGLATFVSDQESLRGITEGIQFINEKIKGHMHNQEQEDESRIERKE